MNRLFCSKKNKIISLMLIGGLILSSGLAYGYYGGSTVSASSKNEKEMKTAEKEISKNYPALLKSNGENLGKLETTYAIMDGDSNLKDVVVSAQLSNSENSKELKDFSTLDKIENTSGNEKFSKNGKDILWKADGNRISYKGKATKELPVKVNVSYYLNGEKKSAKEIAGKSGNIKIRFEYDIAQKDVVNGRTYLHPYTMVSGIILDNSHFSDVKVTNGKAIDDGSKTVAFGLAMPGMNENLGINKSKLDIPSVVEISAFTDKFNIMGTYSIAMSGIVNDIDTSKTDELKSKADTLKTGLEKLASTSKELLKGTETLESGAMELNNGIVSLQQGLGKLQNGSGQLLSGMKTLNDGLKSLSSNSAKINSGVAQLENSIFESATSQLREATENGNITLTPKNYIQVINGISDGAVGQAEAKLRGALSSQGVKDKSIQTQILSVAYNNLMSQNKADASRKDVEEAVKDAGEIAKKAAFVVNAIENNSKKIVPLLKLKGYSEDQITPEIIAVASTALELAGGDPLKMESKIPEATEICKAAAIFKNGAINAKDNVTKLAAIAVGKETPSKLADLKNKLDQVESLVAGINQYTAGVDSAAAGGEKLLVALNALDTGIGQAHDGSNKLKDGSNKLLEGIAKLNSGMSRFDKEGIEKFTSVLSDNEISAVIRNFEGIKEASKREVFVGGKLDDMTGESKILFKTGEVK